MPYIWVNPVTESMYEVKILTDFLQNHGYKQVKSTEDWLNIVKEKYLTAVRQASGPVMDMRCPKTKEVLDEMGVTPKFTIPAIEPILIHCAREISAREDLQGEEKVITTPCQALADMGNALELPNTTFMAWNQFLAMLGDKPLQDNQTQQLKESPIPPGFFEDLGVRTLSATGEEDIKAYFANDQRKDIQLVEMLSCKHGCHNGDGIIVADVPTTRKCGQ